MEVRFNLNAIFQFVFPFFNSWSVTEMRKEKKKFSSKWLSQTKAFFVIKFEIESIPIVCALHFISFTFCSIYATHSHWHCYGSHVMTRRTQNRTSKETQKPICILCLQRNSVCLSLFYGSITLRLESICRIPRNLNFYYARRAFHSI